MPNSTLLTRVVLEPRDLAGLRDRDWETLIPLGRRHGISGRWYQQMETLGTLEAASPAVRHHLWSDHLLAANQARMVHWETGRIQHALGHLQLPLVILKGGAYILNSLPPGRGRLVSDVDIMVPFRQLDLVEAALKSNGWMMQPTTSYDDKYFREWMHELPPLQHGLRGTVVDVHHNILPRTCRLCPAPEPLFERAIPSAGGTPRILCPSDMLIHSILHGFYNGEFTNCFRDILDVHELIGHFQSTVTTFWPEFVARVETMGCGRPVYYALRYARRMFGTEIPHSIMREFMRCKPSRVARHVMDFAVSATFVPSITPTLQERLGLRLLQVRAHWIKMPPLVLAGHLAYKLGQRLTTRPERTGVNAG